ncbi:MAG TPA: hypothetical protein VGA67_04315 [Candidatus Dojkabacteria bacterium]|jgi:hypothetical protein
MTLAVDIDDTIADTRRIWFELFHEKYGHEKSVDELIPLYRQAEYVPEWNMANPEEWAEKLILSDDFNLNIKPRTDALEFISKVNEIMPIRAYVTGRPQRVKSVTEKWIKENLFPDAELILRPDDIDHYKRNKWKAEFIESKFPDISAIIDDEIGLAKSISADYPGKVYLFDYNKGDLASSNVVEVPDWQHFFDLIIAK